MKNNQTNIILPENLHKRIKRFALEHSITMSEVIRIATKSYLDECEFELDPLPKDYKEKTHPQVLLYFQKKLVERIFRK